MTNPAEKLDPGHYCGLLGGGVMFFVMGLCTVGLMFPWWTSNVVMPGFEEQTEVSLWIRYTRYRLESDATTLNCDNQCDFTMLGAAKIRESREGWSDVCLDKEPATEELKFNCKGIWVARVGVMLCWFLSLLFFAFSTFNFWGAGQPSSARCAPMIKLGLAACCAIGAALSLCIAASMDVRLTPDPPGTAPVPEDMRPPTPKVGLNGLGFMALVVACFASILGVFVAYLNQDIMTAIHALHDPESGRDIAYVNRDVAPSLHHQVQADNKELHLNDSLNPSAVSSLTNSRATSKGTNPSRGQSKEAPKPLVVGGWVTDN